MTKTIMPYGSWPSVITSQMLTQGINKLSQPQLDGDNCYWLESRPEQKGRTTIICKTVDGEQRDIIPQAFNVRTRIHEYGGGSYCAHNGVVYFINNSDQRIYSLPINASETDQKPIPLTPTGEYRYGDLCIDEQRQQLICVCEIHKEKQEPENCIIAVKLDGSSTVAFSLLVFGNDFYANPQISPEGNHLSWSTWKHPYMPWDNSECWIAEISQFSLLQRHHKVAGGVDDGSRKESVFQPQWSPTGELFFISDRSQWWNIYRYNLASKTTTCVLEKTAEFATPQWVFGMSTYGFLNSFTLFCTYTTMGHWYAATIDTMTGQFTPLDLPYSHISAITCDDEADTSVFIADTETELSAIIQWQKHQTTTLIKSGEPPIEQREFSIAEAITFQNNNNQDVHGFYYPPNNQHYADTEAALPPLLVICHGGPTGATNTALNLKIQYWTNRGFAVFDINYSGSTGYGRTYRDRLIGQWGILDVDDICSGADHLIQIGRVDPERIAVRGSSAGGYSVLAALTFRNSFKAGASLYGIGDLILLANDTHKFESHYLDQLIGPYPKEKALYEARSPLNHIDKLTCPVIFFQGLEDKVVPPNQAEAMVNGLAEKNIPVAYVTFEGEGHGFRQAKNIRYALDSEYAFYASIFNLTPVETLPTVPFFKSDDKNTTVTQEEKR